MVYSSVKRKILPPSSGWTNLVQVHAANDSAETFGEVIIHNHLSNTCQEHLEVLHLIWQLVWTDLYEMPVSIIQLLTSDCVPLQCAVELYLHQQFSSIQLSKDKGLFPRIVDWRWTQVKYRTILLTSPNEHRNVHDVTYRSTGYIIHHHSYKAVCNIFMTKCSCCQIWNSLNFHCICDWLHITNMSQFVSSQHTMPAVPNNKQHMYAHNN